MNKRQIVLAKISEIIRRVKARLKREPLGRYSLVLPQQGGFIVHKLEPCESSGAMYWFVGDEWFFEPYAGGVRLENDEVDAIELYVTSIFPSRQGSEVTRGDMRRLKKHAGELALRNDWRSPGMTPEDYYAC